MPDASPGLSRQFNRKAVSLFSEENSLLLECTPENGQPVTGILTIAGQAFKGEGALSNYRVFTIEFKRKVAAESAGQRLEFAKRDSRLGHVSVRITGDVAKSAICLCNARWMQIRISRFSAARPMHVFSSVPTKG
jgi:hypothetical protein